MVVGHREGLSWLVRGSRDGMVLKMGLGDGPLTGNKEFPDRKSLKDLWCGGFLVLWCIEKRYLVEYGQVVGA